MTSRAKLSKSSRSSRRPKQRAGSPSTGRPVRQAALAEVKDDLSRFLRLAESEEILITRHGKPAGILIGFESVERTGSTPAAQPGRWADEACAGTMTIHRMVTAEEGRF
jgi:prevent-host-death family protein